MSLTDTGGEPDAVAPGKANAEPTILFSQFIRMLEDGNLDADMSEALRDLNARMNDFVAEFGTRKAKGKMTLELDFTLEDGIFAIVSKFKTKAPEAPRGRSIAWSTPGNNFTPENPRQMKLFDKPRDVGVDELRRV